MLCFSCSKRRDSPNLVLITLDTTRADVLGVYGQEPSPSPNFDALAAKSILFEHAYSPSSWTLPTHASLFTGLLPYQHAAGSLAPGGDTAWQARPLAQEFTTLAEQLKIVGYRTSAIIAGAAMASEFGLDQGFDHYDADFSNPGVRVIGRRARDVTERAIATLGDKEGDPFFLFVNFFDPHRPYSPPAREAPKDLPPAALYDTDIFAHLGSEVRSIRELPVEVKKKYEAQWVRYKAEVAYMDKYLGQLLHKFDSMPPERQPIVVITSDHGEGFGEHHATLHGFNLYEDNVHVPLLIYDPRNPEAAGRVVTATATHRIFAELLNRAGVAIPPHADTTPLQDEDAPILLQLSRTQIALTLLGDHADRDLMAIYDFPVKYIESTKGERELYRIDTDPEELNNLIDEEPDTADKMAKLLQNEKEKTKAIFSGADAAKISPETEDALRSLGYLD